jgi:hypothetical protein
MVSRQEASPTLIFVRLNHPLDTIYNIMEGRGWVCNSLSSVIESTLGQASRIFLVCWSTRSSVSEKFDCMWIRTIIANFGQHKRTHPELLKWMLIILASQTFTRKRGRSGDLRTYIHVVRMRNARSCHGRHICRSARSMTTPGPVSTTFPVELKN